MQKNLKEHGRSMIEMLGVLAIIGVLSIGGLLGYNAAMRKNKINNLISEFTLYVSEMSAIYVYIKHERKAYSSVQGADISHLKKAALALGATVSGPNFGWGNYDYYLTFPANLSDDVCLALASIQMEKGTGIGNVSQPWYAVGSQSAMRFCLTRDKNKTIYFLFGFAGTFGQLP
jgi:type II secretory pathway pseudopilin PulG